MPGKHSDGGSIVNRLHCPLRSDDCIENRCAWWIEFELTSRCAIWGIGFDVNWLCEQPHKKDKDRDTEG